MSADRTTEDPGLAFEIWETSAPTCLLTVFQMFRELVSHVESSPWQRTTGVDAHWLQSTCSKFFDALENVGF